MDMKTLITFQTIIKQGSFNRAAQQLNYAQSTVTMQIQKLEAEIGMQLLERGKEVALTEAGRLFYEQSHRIVKNLEQLHSTLEELKSGEAGDIRVGVTEPSASHRLPGLLNSFLARYPKVRISIEISNSSQLSSQLSAGELDFAICSVSGFGSDLYFEPIFEEEFVVLLPESHPLARLEVVEPENLLEDRLLFTSTSCPYRRKLELAMQESGKVPLHTMEIGSMTALKFYAENGLGIAPVPKILTEPGTKGLTVRPIGGNVARMTTGFLYKKTAYPFTSASRKLYLHIKEALLGQI
ncbi:LysR family transcriptional regulator [Cohnella sp.]|uniref:LysR family transcriptional regulator n=1 Tax=Cohnella sp. TaxID=1883426 RepID=UPI003567E997